ncbi:membrane protein, putative [Babesia bigemina]|uniref:Membrane protein, putative n=1 Tax=Babesia bigemina TaxID=5866 RepID=A0A061DA28_BABBI|nr:membrane protein, putative [Babesia bigemina]CDR97576.1 membrane protein, putative [Babesia bigemina]|eukprot:XP_012769762.1 membrane protein, putative [Babesia bigemina]
MRFCSTSMFGCFLNLSILLVACPISYSRKVWPSGGYTLATLGNNGVHEHTFRRRWTLSSNIQTDVEAKLRLELVRLAAQLPNSSNLPLHNAAFLQKEATRIRELIVPDSYQVYLNKYYAVKRIQHRGFLGDFIAFVFGVEEVITFSAWQYRPNILYKGGNLTLEIHYKIPIREKGIKDLFFEPIVVYTCDVTPGKYVEGAAVFKPGSVEILTHPFIPWKRISAGTVEISAPRQPTIFSPHMTSF